MEEDLEEIFEEFGEISLCRIVMDRGTEHSKGKFKFFFSKCYMYGSSFLG